MRADENGLLRGVEASRLIQSFSLVYPAWLDAKPPWTIGHALLLTRIMSHYASVARPTAFTPRLPQDNRAP